jgi:hypothetical protein
MYSPKEREHRGVLAQEHKDLSCMIRVLRQEFDKLQELLYVWQALKIEEQQC